MIVNALKRLGPCLSTDLTDYLVKQHRLTPAAARQRVSRAPAEVKSLGHLPFQRKSRFLYLQSDWASPRYWLNLYQAIDDTKGPYARALSAVRAREVLPIAHFRIACGAPIAQKKQISADAVLQRLVSANVLVKEPLPGLGDCVMTKQMSEALAQEQEFVIAMTRSRLIAESILLDSIKEWLRRLAFVSFDSIKVRSNEGVVPQVGTFAWDMTAPSYLAALTTWHKGTKKPGFVVCDVLLNDNDEALLLKQVEPYLHKFRTLKALKNIGRTMFIFVAQRYDSEAFKALKTAGVVPATPESLFGVEVAEAFRELLVTLTNAALGALDPVKFDKLFNTLSKIEGAAGNMRGAFFELLVAEVVRKTSPAQIQLNKICTGKDGQTAEVDVWELKEGIIARMIECKGMAPGTMVDDEEVGKWLTTRITRVRHHLSKTPEFRCLKPYFELWTSGILSADALARIEKTRQVNVNQFELVVVGPEKLREKVQAVKDKALLKTFENHFIPLP